ncbi:MAG: DUF4276 family protein [Prevotellaceae bacterium]|jgi:hypothetical protein|nr:DUF4276 family protein [Prevotellaceae bacterium]
MSVVVLHVLCEGQTEERFASSVLKPYLKEFGIVVKTTILTTNRKKRIRGGMLSYRQAKTDLELLMKQHAPKRYEQHFYTTMFDLYALPTDFPAYVRAHHAVDCYEVVQLLEDAFAQEMNHPRFIPYIQLHEFEALVFCGLDYLLDEYPDMKREIEHLKQVIKTSGDNTERINNTPQTAPSKRIIQAFEGKHHYDKPKLGVFVTHKVGIATLKEKCPHFKKWIAELEQLGAS